jgi:histidinol-phosphatase (PHP family)
MLFKAKIYINLPFKQVWQPDQPLSNKSKTMNDNLITQSPNHLITKGKTDFHLHTDFSADSQIKLRELVPHAIELGYSQIAITEHLDLLPNELVNWGIPSITKYKAAIDAMRKQYSQIRIIFGIEVGDFHRVKPFAQSILSEVPFDLILGSVHFLLDHTNVAMPMDQPLSKEQVREYYEQNLELVQTCDFDVLAHLGVYKRYYVEMPDESHCLPIVKQIFATIIEKNIALELNFSAFRRTYKFLHPDPPYLDLYKSMGGKLISIGSDSHKLDQIDDYYTVAKAAVDKYGFELLTV